MTNEEAMAFMRKHFHQWRDSAEGMFWDFDTACCGRCYCGQWINTTTKADREDHLNEEHIALHVLIGKP